jgi:hypothetical protein
MSVAAILAPLFVQVALTLALGIWLGALRVSAVRRREVKMRDIALREPNWPSGVTQVGNCYLNQFELPVLYYVLTALAMATRQADLLFVAMAWVFVLTRLAHAYVHVTDNHLGRRGLLFGVGAAVIALMWLIFAARILIAT